MEKVKKSILKEIPLKDIPKLKNSSFSYIHKLNKNRFPDLSLEEKKKKFSEWVKRNYLFMGLLVFTIIVRFYYFTITNGQPLWWDEAEYMSGAKGYAGIVDYTMGGNRLPGFSLFMSIFFRLGLSNETFLRFTGLLIPSILVIVLTYFCVAEMYKDKRIAFFSAMIFSVLWEHLFYSNRFQTENFALVFQLLAVLVLFRAYLKKQDLWIITPKYSLLWILLFSGLSIFCRVGNFLFVPALVFFIVILNWKKLIIKKNLIYTGGVLIFLILSPLFAGRFYKTIIKSYFQLNNPFAWVSLSSLPGFFPSVTPLPSFLFWAFLIGLFLAIFEISINKKYLLNLDSSKTNLETKSDIFVILTLFSVMTYFIFVLRSPTYEFRWFFPFALSMLVLVSKGIFTFSEYLARGLGKKKWAFAIMMVILIIGLHSQLIYSNNIIVNKLNSYGEVKESGFWIKQNSNTSDSIVSASIPQHTYYAERKVYDFYPDVGTTEEDFMKEINSTKPKYLVISIFEPGFTPDWAYTLPTKYPDEFTLVKTYSLSTGQPALAIYKITYS